MVSYVWFLGVGRKYFEIDAGSLLIVLNLVQIGNSAFIRHKVYYIEKISKLGSGNNSRT